MQHIAIHLMSDTAPGIVTCIRSFLQTALYGCMRGGSGVPIDLLMGLPEVGGQVEGGSIR